MAELNDNLRAKLGVSDSLPGTTFDSESTMEQVGGDLPEGAYAPPVGAVPVSEPQPLEPSADSSADSSADPAVAPSPALAGLSIDIRDALDNPSDSVEMTQEDHALDEVQTAITDDVQRNAFIKLRRELRDAKQTVAPVAEQDDTRLNEVLDELEQANSTIGKLNLSESPTFRKKFEVPLEQKFSQAMRYAEAAGVNTNLVEQAVGMGLAERSDFVQDNFGNMGSTVMTLLADIDGLNAQRNAELVDWRASKEVLDAQGSERETAVRGEVMRSAFSDAVTSLQSEDFLPFTYIEGNQGWNDTVDQFQSEAWKLFERDDIGMQAKAMAAGIAAPHLLRSYLAERDENISLREQIASLSASTPNPSNRVAPASMANSEGGGMSNAKDAARRASQRFSQR